MRIYLDTCCYNRPYDDQSQIRINLETRAKIFIQNLIRQNLVELATSYVIEYENSNSRYATQRIGIKRFVDEYSSVYVDEKCAEYIEKSAKVIMNSGIKEKDAMHIASAVLSECDYFISTYDRLLKYVDKNVLLVNPIDFLRVWEAHGDE